METTATKLKFTTQQEDLLALAPLARIATKEPYNNIYTNGAVAWSSNGSLTIHTVLTSSVQEPTTIAINAQKLYNVISVSSGTITFDNGTITAKGKKSKINGISTEILSCEDVIGTDYTVNAKEFINQLKRTVYACQEGTNSVLSGVLLDNINIVATDGNILVCNSISEQVLDEQIILPAKFVDELIKVFSNADTLTLTTDKGAVKVTDGVTTIISRLLEGTYPKYAQLIPATSANNATIDRLELLDALSFADTMINIRTNIAKLNFTADKLDISTSSEDGESNATIDINYTGENMLIAFNAQYLNKMLKSYSSSTIKIGMNSNLSAALITDGESEDVALIMPIQIRG